MNAKTFGPYTVGSKGMITTDMQAINAIFNAKNAPEWAINTLESYLTQARAYAEEGARAAKLEMADLVATRLNQIFEAAHLDRWEAAPRIDTGEPYAGIWIDRAVTDLRDPDWVVLVESDPTDYYIGRGNRNDAYLYNDLRTTETMGIVTGILAEMVRVADMLAMGEDA